MGRSMIDLILALLTEQVADLGENGRDDRVEQMMALNIQIGGLRGHTQRLDILLGGQILFLGIRELTLQVMDLGTHLPSDIVDRGLRVLHIKATRVGDAVQVSDGEPGIVAVAIEHDRPHEQGEEGLTELTEILAEVKDTVVVERHRHTHVMQRGCITLEVLDGINIGMEDIRAVEHLLRLMTATPSRKFISTDFLPRVRFPLEGSITSK